MARVGSPLKLAGQTLQRELRPLCLPVEDNTGLGRGWTEGGPELHPDCLDRPLPGSSRANALVDYQGRKEVNVTYQWEIQGGGKALLLRENRLSRGSERELVWAQTSCEAGPSPEAHTGAWAQLW